MKYLSILHKAQSYKTFYDHNFFNARNKLECLPRRHDTHYDDIQHDDNKHNCPQHNNKIT